MNRRRLIGLILGVAGLAFVVVFQFYRDYLGKTIFKDSSPGVNLSYPLATGAAKGDIHLVKLLVAQGSDVNVGNPLDRAIAGGHWAVADFLISKGAKVLPEHIFSAVSSGSVDLVKLLVSNGADVSLKTSSGRTPLHYTAQGNHKEIGEFLIARGVDMDAADESKLTPLHLACQHDSRGMALLLIESGAKINPLDNEGRTPFDYAETIYGQQLACVLQKYGCKWRMFHNAYKGYDVRFGKWSGAPFGGGGVVSDWQPGDEEKRWKAAERR